MFQCANVFDVFVMFCLRFKGNPDIQAAFHGFLSSTIPCGLDLLLILWQNANVPSHEIVSFVAADHFSEALNL